MSRKGMKEKNEIMARTFIMFLKANGAFVPYMNAVKEQGKTTASFPYFMKHFDRTFDESLRAWKGFIFCAFTWAGTKEGKRNPSYWSNLHSKWLKIVEKIVINNYEISEDISRSILSRSN